jgi:hypothetical protein
VRGNIQQSSAAVKHISGNYMYTFVPENAKRCCCRVSNGDLIFESNHQCEADELHHHFHIIRLE